jgi:hypothetical protein
VSIKHAFTSLKPDGLDATKIRPSNWNAAHLGLVHCRKAADQSISTTGFADSTDMVLAVPAAGTYLFEFVVFFTTNAATVGIRLSVNGPAASAVRWGVQNPMGAVAAGNLVGQAQAAAYNAEPVVFTAGPGTGGAMAILSGSIVATAAGNLQLRHGSETATATTILAGSWGRLTTL